MPNGYEFVNGRAALRPDFDYERILSLASDPDAAGYRVATVEVAAGETAWNPGSTKHVLHGPVTVRYEIHPSGVRGVIV